MYEDLVARVLVIWTGSLVVVILYAPYCKYGMLLSSEIQTNSATGSWPVSPKELLNVFM